MSEPNDLSNLIQQAEKTAHSQAEAKPAPKSKPLPWRMIFSVLLAGVIAYAGTKVSAGLSPPSQKEVAHDLEAVLDRAHDVIETAKAESGELPEALPNAALASVVEYEHDRTGYQLTATIMGVKVTMERSGRKTTDMGEKQ